MYRTLITDVYGLAGKICTSLKRSAFSNNIQRSISASCVRLSSDIPREDVPISRFPIPERSILHQSVQDRMNETEQKTKFLPNVLSVLSYHQREFECFMNYYDELMTNDTGSLTKAEKELIVVATSAKNNCHYCVVSHSALHRLFSKNPYVADQVAINPECADLTAREKAIVKFSLKVSRMEPIEESDFEEMTQFGLDKDDAWYIGAIAAFFAMSNRLAHLAAMRPNEEFYTLGRIPAPKSEKK